MRALFRRQVNITVRDILQRTVTHSFTPIDVEHLHRMAMRFCSATPRMLDKLERLEAVMTAFDLGGLDAVNRLLEQHVDRAFVVELLEKVRIDARARFWATRLARPFGIPGCTGAPTSCCSRGARC